LLFMSKVFGSENTKTKYINIKSYKYEKKDKRRKKSSHSYTPFHELDKELECEKTLRHFDYKTNTLDPFTLPIKTKDGKILPKKTQSHSKEILVESKGEIPHMPIAKTVQKETKTLSKDIREQLASIAQAIIENPEENIKQLKTLREMTLDQTVTIQRLGLLTQLAVYKDIVPGYSIRPLTDIEKASHMSKETKQRRSFEESLVSNYYAYICLLSETIKAGKNSPENSAQRFLSDISFSCICHLLLSIPHFNYRSILLEIVSVKLTQKIPDTSFIECRKTIEELFENDKEGRISFEIVKKLTNNYNINDTVLNTFLKLEFLSQSDLTIQKKENNPLKRKYEKQFKSKKIRKLEKKNKKMEIEIDDIEETNKEREKFQGEILKLIFTTYFQILQNGLVNLICASLEGLKKFSHLINIDFFEDLLKMLKELLENKFSVEPNISVKNSTKGGLLCIITAFKLLSEQEARIKKIVNLDLSTFVIYLYSIMIPMSLNSCIETNSLHKSEKYNRNMNENHSFSNSTEIEIFAECFDYIFFQDKNLNLLKASAFIKRLFTVLLGFPEKSVLKSLELIQKLIKKHPRFTFLLNSNEKYGEVPVGNWFY
ncbi:hypothetical protein PORY_000700, partial [Pneumocystis oryctolagi]